MNFRYLLSVASMLLISALLFFSCKKDIKNEPPPDDSTSAFPIPAASPVTGLVSGVVIDENNQPVNNATVRLGSTVKSTDTGGSFNFEATTLDKYITTVSVTLPGYYKAYRSFSANATRNYLVIKLIPKTLAGTVNSANAETVSLSNGSTLSFQANSVVIKATGAVYSGIVNVYASYIDPTVDDISAVVPGSFIGKDANNLYALGSAGMIAVEMESVSGEALQLAANKAATMKMLIPPSLVSNAPATIDTWSLNDQGIWEKESTAAKSGNFYEAQVSHFSFWNCDVPMNAIYLSLHVQDQNNQPIVNSLVELTIQNNTTNLWTTAGGYTDAQGNVSGLVPAGMGLILNVYGVGCYNTIFTQNIGPYSQSATVTITGTVPASSYLTVSGTVIDCNNQPLTGGTAIIRTGPWSYYYASIVNGNYSFSITQCSPTSSVVVTAIDNTGGGQGNSGTVAVSAGVANVPVITACNIVPALFTFGNAPGQCQQGIPPTGIYVAGTALNPGNTVALVVDVAAPGSYNISTTTVNGISFSASGVFTTLGQQPVILTGTGIPTVAGVYLLPTSATGVTGCDLAIQVSSPPASFDFAGPGGCSSFTVAGVYAPATTLNTGNHVSFTVNVTVPGAYVIYSDTLNGISFVGSGIFTSTGLQTVTLSGSGTPLNAATNTYTPHSTGGTNNCSFDITATSAGLAVYGFESVSGVCTGNVQGTFQAQVPINGAGLSLSVNVFSPGPYSIQAQGPGFSFSISGTFITTGIHSLWVPASGTPQVPGNVPIEPQAVGVIPPPTACQIVVTVIP